MPLKIIRKGRSTEWEEDEYRRKEDIGKPIIFAIYKINTVRPRTCMHGYKLY